jgi:hypothetical protein
MFFDQPFAPSSAEARPRGMMRTSFRIGMSASLVAAERIFDHLRLARFCDDVVSVAARRREERSTKEKRGRREAHRQSKLRQPASPM